MKRRASARSLRRKLAPRFHFRQTVPLALLILAAGLGKGAAGSPAVPATHVDISAVANTDFEDDGIAGNGKGGWSDEGVNDMFLYPPIPYGDSAVNGYAFRILDPAENNGKAVIMLKGRKLAGKPEQVVVPVANVKGKFVYFLQNSVHSVPNQPANYRAATYTVRYADGTWAEIPIRDGIELRRWWVGRWYDNSGAASWPIFIGQNPSSMKWNQFVAVYAMEWANPHPDKSITSITLKSAALCSPAVFAITIADEQFSNGPNAKENYKRPPDAPAGYFDKKLAIEQERVFKEMVKQDMIKGIRKVEVIAPDLLGVTLDAIVARGIGMGKEKAEAMEKREAFAVSSTGDDAYKVGAAPTKVGRISYEVLEWEHRPVRAERRLLAYLLPAASRAVEGRTDLHGGGQRYREALQGQRDVGVRRKDHRHTGHQGQPGGLFLAREQALRIPRLVGGRPGQGGIRGSAPVPGH